MLHRTAVRFLGLVLACLALVGCASPYAYYCDDGCGGPPSLSGRYGAAGCGAVQPHGGCCDTCDSVPCACGGSLVDGVHAIKGALHATATCEAGCGDVYCGEWSYDPPDYCDPCNSCGDFVGPRGCTPCGFGGKIIQGLLIGLHGARDCPVGCDSGCAACCAEPVCGAEPGCGCDDCGSVGHGVMEEPYVIEDPYLSDNEFTEALDLHGAVASDGAMVPTPARQSTSPRVTNSVLRRSPQASAGYQARGRLTRRPVR